MVRWFMYMLCVAVLHTGNAIRDTSSDRNLRALQTLGQVDRFVLINADTNLPIVDLLDGTVINIATQSTSNFNIQATVVENSGPIGSIKFGYNTKPTFRVETGAPYAFCGDGQPVGNYFTCTNLNTTLDGQSHVVSATPYSGIKANGTMGVKKVVSFRIVNIPPTPAPVLSPTKVPSSAPTNQPSGAPTNQPSSAPTNQPSSAPTKQPSSAPTKPPSSAPTKQPSSAPTNQPSSAPIKQPSSAPTNQPSSTPSSNPIPGPNCNIPQFLDSGWTGILPNIPMSTEEPMGLLIGNDFVSFSGFIDRFDATTNITYARDITTAGSPWRRMDDMPLEVSVTHAPTVLVGMKVYMCGGYWGGHPGPHAAYCFIYDHSIPPGSGLQWTRFADLPNNGYAGGGMIYDALQDALYFAGGGQRLTPGNPHPVDSDRAFKYSLQNPSAGWVEIAPIPYKANHLSSVTQTYLGKQHHFFVGGQKGEYEAQQNLADFYEFIASNETWAARTFMPFGRGHATSSTRPIGCGFFIAGGAVNSITTKKNRTTNILYYDIPTDNWTSIGDLYLGAPHATPRVDIHTDGYIYYVGNKRSNRRRIAA